jgi:predicted transcriptional regulator
MNYTIDSIRIPSRWFDMQERKKNTFQKMGGYKGLYLYLQMYKFRIHQQENDHTFITSISFLRKETGYSTSEVFELLKKLKGAKIINISGVSRWDYLIDENGVIKEDKILLITANENESFPIYKDFDKQDEFYIYISFNLLQQYIDKGLDEKHFALHCLVQRFQHSKSKVCFMSIQTMAEILDIDKDTVNRMIINLNKNYLMVSWKKPNTKNRGEGSYHYEHITYEDNAKYKNESKGLNNWEGWLNQFKQDMDVVAKRAAKKAEKKKKQRDKKPKLHNVTLSKNANKPITDGYWGESDDPFAKNKQSVDYFDLADTYDTNGMVQIYLDSYSQFEELGIQNYKKYKESKAK